MLFPSDLTTAPVDLGELDELTEFVQAVCLAESGRKHFTRQELASIFAMPGFEPARDTLVLRDADGKVVGAEWIETKAPSVRFHASGFVAPDRIGEGIGTALLEWARGVADSRLREAPEGARVTLEAGVDTRHDPSLALLVGMGMELVRYFLEMRIDFEGPITEPRIPSGVEVRNFCPGEDDVVTYQAVDEAFRDHWGHVDHPMEAGLERFRHWMQAEFFDPTLWWLALEDGEVVGANLCEPSVEGDPGIGYVGSLSVRKPWRGRGLARALLLLSFREFHRRGKRAATLHVDAESLTGATRLYQSVGMREPERYASFAMELRPGRDLSVR